MTSAEDVGMKLLGEVEECGLDELLRSSHVHDEPENRQYFSFAHLDRLLNEVEHQRSQFGKGVSSPPTIELMSLASGGGKTHLLYHLSAIAVLPREIGGRQECVVIIDTDGRFTIQRLAAQIQLLIRRHHSSESTEVLSDDYLSAETTSTLKHIHIFHPQSVVSTIATLDDLPNYLFNYDRHYSFDREIAFIALDSASVFYWQDRSETENATFLAKTTPTAGGTQTSAYFQLATALKMASKTFDCPVIFTSWYLGPQQKSGDGTGLRAFRPQLPPLQASLRLVLHRLPVRKFPAGLSLDGALREANDRQKAVVEGRFECFVNQWGLDERLLRQISDTLFEFRILNNGLWIEGAKDVLTEQT